MHTLQINAPDGELEGIIEGFVVGILVGLTDGFVDGTKVGNMDGLAVMRVCSLRGKHWMPDMFSISDTGPLPK